MSVLDRCPSYKESNKGNKQRQGPTLGVRLIEVSVKRGSTIFQYFLNGRLFWFLGKKFSLRTQKAIDLNTCRGII